MAVASAQQVEQARRGATAGAAYSVQCAGVQVCPRNLYLQYPVSQKTECSIPVPEA